MSACSVFLLKGQFAPKSKIGYRVSLLPVVLFISLDSFGVSYLDAVVQARKWAVN